MKKKLQCLTAAGLFVALTAVFVVPVLANEEKPKSGWQQEGDRWVYLNRDGTRKTETWIKGEDGFYYYLDEDGYMAVDTIIKDDDNIYYVNEDGVRIKNRWVSEPNDDLCDQEVDVLWYYFGKDGKAMKEEGKGVKIKEGSAEYAYFFDSDGHMLSGWQEITNKKGDTHIYYLGDENQGHVHKQWQYLEVDEDFFDLDPSETDYDSYEFYYFAYDGHLCTGKQDPDGKHYLFDDNGIMLKGWQPGSTALEGKVNRYYDEETGERVSGWLYATDPDDEDSDPHWFYCDDNGYLFNEGNDGLAFKRIDGKTYFFDTHGHMLTGLISTGDADIADSAFAEEEFSDLSGWIGSKPEGIYYLSQDEGSLGQLQSDKRLHLSDGYETEYYYLSSTGYAYTNALIKGCIYGVDGKMIYADSDKEAVTVNEDIYPIGEFTRNGLKDDPKPIIKAGDTVIINTSGKVTQKGTVKIDGETYEVNDYIALQK